MKLENFDDNSAFCMTGCVRPDCDEPILLNEGESDWRDALDLSLKIQKCESWNELAEVCVYGICGLYGAVDVRWLEMTSDGKRALWTCSSAEEHAEFLRMNLETIIERSVELGAFYQKVGSFIRGESEEIYCLSDDLADSDMEGNPYVQAFLEPMGVNDILSMQVYFSRGGAVILSLGMSARGMSKAGIEILGYLQSHIKVACSHLSRLTSFSNLTGALSELRQRGQSVGISVVSKDGDKLWETDDVSTGFLKELGGSKNEAGDIQMPDELAVWVQSTVEDKKRLCADPEGYSRIFQTWSGMDVEVSLFLERAGSGALLVLKGGKKSVDYGGVFTRRELDVIQCISGGMPSQKVSENLAISKRTVDKHLENIYIKLGVNNRLAAVKRLQEL
jgi:DNA-binding CsgD family transcriptional regulator